MPTTVPEALARVAALVRTSGTHPDYARTVEHATLLRDLAAGNIRAHLRRFVSRETPADYEARLNLTVSTAPAVIAELATPFVQVSALKGSQVEKRFDYDAPVSEAEAARRRDRLTSALGAYYDARPVEDYLSERVMRHVAITDPNAWLLTTFENYDFRSALPRPAPVLLPCELVADFTRAAGVVESVTFRVQLTTPGGTGSRYVVYLANEALECWPVIYTGTTPVYTLPEGAAVYETIRDEDGRALAQVRLLQHRAGRVPASPVGWVPDPLTEGRTYVSPLYPALPFLLKGMGLDSELDITMQKVVHPHKSQYVPACPGEPNQGCTGGVTSTGNTCTRCNGTALSPIATSAMDVAIYPLPKNPDDTKLKLNELVYFSIPPMELPKFQLEYQDKLVERASRALFNTSTLTKTTLATTATERLAEAAQKNTALRPAADWLSRTYVYHAQVTAGYLDVATDLRITYGLPPDLVAIDVADLEEQYGLAVKAGYDAAYLQLLYLRTVRQRLADNPEELRKMLVRLRFVPYVGLSDAQFQQYAVLNYIPVEKRTLRIEQDSIFYEVEAANPGFYDLAPVQQQQLVDTKVKELVAALPVAAAAGGTFGRMNFSNQPAQPVAATM